MADTTTVIDPETGKRRRKRLNETKITGVLAERTLPNGKRAIMLRKNERKSIQERAMVEKAVALFLDYSTQRTWKEIAQELGVAMTVLKDITKSDLFNEVYNEYFAELGHDPRLKATQMAIADMLPLAYKTLKDLVTNPATPAPTRLSAIKEIFRLGGVNEPAREQSNRQEFIEFMKNVGLNIGEVNVSIPAEFAMAETIIDMPSLQAPVHAEANPDEPDYSDDNDPL